MGVPAYDPEASAAAATGGASTTSGASKDIFGLGEYGKYRVNLGVAYKERTGFSGYNKLPYEDREGSPGRSLAPGTQGPFIPGGGMPRVEPSNAANGVAVGDTVESIMRKFELMPYGKGSEEFLQWQRMLYKAGLYGSTKLSEVAWGSFDGPTEDALGKALRRVARANEAGAPISLTEYLDKLGADRDKAAKQYGPGADPTLRQFENPRVVAGFLQQAAQAALGRNLTKDEIDHFVSEYHASEEQYYKTAESAQRTPGTHDLTKPDAATAAQDFVQAGHAAEAGGQGLAGFFQTLQGMIGGDAGG